MGFAQIRKQPSRKGASSPASFLIYEIADQTLPIRRQPEHDPKARRISAWAAGSKSASMPGPSSGSRSRRRVRFACVYVSTASGFLPGHASCWTTSADMRIAWRSATAASLLVRMDRCVTSCGEGQKVSINSFSLATSSWTSTRHHRTANKCYTENARPEDRATVGIDPSLTDQLPHVETQRQAESIQ